MSRQVARLAFLLISAAGLAFAMVSTVAAGKRSDAEVKVNVESSKAGADGKQVITVFLDINKGWHVYSNPVGNDDLAAAQTVVTVAGKAKPASVKIDYPTGHVINDKVLGKYSVYDGKVTIKANVQRAAGDSEPLEVSVRFQACSENNCLLPATVKRTVP